jgi:hypothetical protein
MKTLLKYVGNFVELGYDDHPNAPSLVLLRGKRKLENKDRVIAYLKSGTTLVYSPGRDDDVLDATKTAGSASIATDGVYVWPRTLAYYVQDYDVELPAEFEAHMQRCEWIAPETIDKSSVELPRGTPRGR